MEITRPTDCGNSPRTLIVGDFTAAWVAGESAQTRSWLTDETRWIRVGIEPEPGSENEPVPPPFAPQRAEITSLITHGRLAACDGHLERDGQRVDFCHMFRFASTAKTATIAEIRTYLIPAAGA